MLRLKRFRVTKPAQSSATVAKSSHSIPPPWPIGLGRGTPFPCLKLRCAGGREFDPRPGQYSRMSFSSHQVTGTVFSHLKLSFQILNLFRTLSSWGSDNYRPSAPILYEVASQVKQLPFRPLLLFLLLLLYHCNAGRCLYAYVSSH